MYYSIPFKALQRTKAPFQTVDVETSVRQHVKMIMLTMPNKVRFEPLYGGALNKHHFRLPDKRRGEKKLEDELKDRTKKNLEFALKRFEPRLKVKDIIVIVHLPKPDRDNPHLKKGRIALEINVKGSIPGSTPEFDYAELVPLL